MNYPKELSVEQIKEIADNAEKALEKYVVHLGRAFPHHIIIKDTNFINDFQVEEDLDREMIEAIEGRLNEEDWTTEEEEEIEEDSGYLVRVIPFKKLFENTEDTESFMRRGQRYVNRGGLAAIVSYIPGVFNRVHELQDIVTKSQSDEKKIPGYQMVIHTQFGNPIVKVVLIEDLKRVEHPEKQEGEERFMNNFDLTLNEVVPWQELSMDMEYPAIPLIDNPFHTIED
jgi:hypothetical protein